MNKTSAVTDGSVAGVGDVGRNCSMLGTNCIINWRVILDHAVAVGVIVNGPLT